MDDDQNFDVIEPEVESSGMADIPMAQETADVVDEMIAQETNDVEDEMMTYETFEANHETEEPTPLVEPHMLLGSLAQNSMNAANDTLNIVECLDPKAIQVKRSTRFSSAFLPKRNAATLVEDNIPIEDVVHRKAMETGTYHSATPEYESMRKGQGLHRLYLKMFSSYEKLKGSLPNDKLFVEPIAGLSEMVRTVPDVDRDTLGGRLKVREISAPNGSLLFSWNKAEEQEFIDEMKWLLRQNAVLVLMVLKRHDPGTVTALGTSPQDAWTGLLSGQVHVVIVEKFTFGLKHKEHLGKTSTRQDESDAAAELRNRPQRRIAKMKATEEIL